jgi:hypothetical protein
MANVNVAAFSSNKSNGRAEQDQESGEVCIANISPFERRKRLLFAIRQFIVTLAVLGVLIVLGLHPLWRLSLFFLFSAATTSYFQVLDKT